MVDQASTRARERSRYRGNEPMSLPAVTRCALVALVVLLALPAGAAAASCKGADKAPTTKTLTRARSIALCLVNRQRAKRGLPKLREDRRLAKAAARHSRDMVRRAYFEHLTPDGRDPGDRIDDTGYPATTWGENIAWGGGRYATPRRIVALWMDSPGHRANILRRGFRETGMGIAIGAPEPGDEGFPAATYTQVFAARG